MPVILLKTSIQAVFGKENDSSIVSMLESFCGGRVDLNHRSQRQQIYSLPPLATRELSLFGFIKPLELVDGLEPRPADYKSAALPAEHTS